MANRPISIPPEGTANYVLYDAGEPVVTAEASWERLGPEHGLGATRRFRIRIRRVRARSPSFDQHGIGGNPGHMLIAPEVAADLY